MTEEIWEIGRVLHWSASVEIGMVGFGMQVAKTPTYTLSYTDFHFVALSDHSPPTLLTYGRHARSMNA